MGPLFTDLYQITMAYAYWASGKHEDEATFELFFRRCPFKGEYAVLGGFDLVKSALDGFHFSSEDIRYLRSLEPLRAAPENFFDYLKSLDLSDLQIYAMDEGEVVFPREPLLQVRGPILKAQLLESALLNSINFASLVSTYARRIKQISHGKGLVEFGMRRAQGPNGAMTATRSSYLGGFDGTSNVASGKTLDIPVIGTMAHSFVQSFREITPDLLDWNGTKIKTHLDKVRQADGLSTNEGELAAFLAYAKVFPHSTLLLVDTYDTLKSGLPNAIRVFKILRELGFEAQGIRLDSGDLVYLSRESRRMLDEAGFETCSIVASNELDERIIESILDQGAMVDAFGVGTQLVTAAEQPALGGVYKLVELNGHPRMKISQQTEKLVIPGAKQVYRFYSKSDEMLLDLMSPQKDPAPLADQEILALHPSDPYRRARVLPSRIEALLKPLWNDGQWHDHRSLTEKREQSLKRMNHLRPDITRNQNPTVYKVSLSERLKALLDELYNKECPPTEIR